MPIAVIPNLEGQDTQAVLSRTVAAWRADGVRVIGVLAENRMEEGVCSAGALRDLISGQVFSIRLDGPAPDTECDLDTLGLSHVATHLLEQLPKAELVVLSKFGKAEAGQGGLWPVFQAAAAAGTPLLTTVSPKHEDAWQAFAPHAGRLTARPEAIMQWWQALAG